MLGSYFDDDPFFMNHREQMRQMNRMMQDPFGFHHSLLGITDGSERGNYRERNRNSHNQLAMPSLFGGFNGLFQNMRSMMDDMHRSFDISTHAGNPNAHMFSQSSFVSMTNTGDGSPKVFQATTSTRQAPGGIKETRKQVRDSETGVEKMSIGHHIRDRAHVVERQHNRRTGDAEENQEFINLDESEARDFNHEWNEKTKQSMRELEYTRRGQRSRHRGAITDGKTRNQSYRDRD